MHGTAHTQAQVHAQAQVSGTMD